MEGVHVASCLVTSRCNFHQSTAVQAKRAQTFQSSYPEDKMDRGNTVIYATHMTTFLHPMYVVLTVSLALTAAVSAITLHANWGTIWNDLHDIDSPAFMTLVMAPLGVGIWIPAFRLMNSSILRIYYNDESKTYTAVLKDGLLRFKKFSFQPSDIRWKKPSVSGNFYIYNFPVHLNEKDFRSSLHYKALVSKALLEKPS